MVLRHVPPIGALTALTCLACGGLGGGEPDEPPPPPPVAVDEGCAEPSCVVIGPNLQVRSHEGRLVVFVDGRATGDRFEDGLVRGVELDGDPRTEVLISRDCGGNGCLPDWWVLDCAGGGRCDEVPLIEQVPDIRVVEGNNARHALWVLGQGTITCLELVRGRPLPCDGWVEVGDPPQTVLAPASTPSDADDGKVVASTAIDLDGDGRREDIACSWWQRAQLLNCRTTLHGVDAAIPAAPSVEILSTRTEGVLDIRANGLTGRWDGGGWVFPW
ncbi:MAG: hypothetical protein KC621_31895 [Myxococcales bacterium]|nr:hypothetical protein [Myxococcales bacterium]